MSMIEWRWKGRCLNPFSLIFFDLELVQFVPVEFSELKTSTQKLSSLIEFVVNVVDFHSHP